MEGITITMALVDLIPVILFFASAVILQRDYYNKMVKGRYALLAAGSIMVLIGGIYKALWKVLVALGICDFVAFNAALFPMQAPGFMLVFLSLIGTKNASKSKVCAYGVTTAVVNSVPQAYTSNLLFIVFQTLGLAGTQFCLMARAIKMKKHSAAVLFVVSFIFMLAMGYLGSKFDSSSKMNWIAQTVNIVSQLSLFSGVMILHKNGLAD